MASEEMSETSQATQNPKRGHEQEEDDHVSENNEQTSNKKSGKHANQAAKNEEEAPLTAEEATPPLPDQDVLPPLPSEAPPGTGTYDDGWEPVWDDTTQAYYFFNRKSGLTQWENPRISESKAQFEPKERPHGGYNPAIHGNYDPNASYAVNARQQEDATQASNDIMNAITEPDYSAAGHFNRFTGKWQAESIKAENYSDEAKSRRQMSAFFDVDAAANSHDGRSLKAERANKKLSKKELKVFKEKRKEKKEEKRRAWLRD